MAKKHPANRVSSKSPTAVRERLRASAAKEERPSARASASLTDASDIHELVAKFASPAGYDRFSLEFGEDSTGVPAVWVRFLVKDDLKPSKEKVASANSLIRTVRSELIEKGHGWWPYVSFGSDS